MPCQVFNSVEIKPEMVGHYLAEFSCSYKPVKHGRPGVRASLSCCYISHLIPSALNRSVRHTVSFQSDQTSFLYSPKET